MPAKPAVSRTPSFSALTALLPRARRDAPGAPVDAAPGEDARCEPAPPPVCEELGCYSQMYSACAEVRTPACVDALAEIFAEARAAGRRVTLRAGGNAFDGQALGDELVVSLERLNDIEPPDARTRCITVGAGARWGDILDAVLPLGLVPAIMVTTENATAGGTLSGNCLSRFSPTFGKEGRWVKSFELLTIGGEQLHCTPPPSDEHPETWTREQRIYMAAIGGLGYVGAVHRITYQLVQACEPSAGATLGVKTTLRKFKDYEHLAEHLVAQAKTMCCAEPHEDPRTLAEHPDDQAIYSALIRRMNAKQSAVVLTSTYTTEPKRKPLVIHRPDGSVRFVCELILRTRLDWILTLAVFHMLMRRDTPYLDDLRGFTFFMDGNARVKAWGTRHKIKMPTVQQTFIVPFDPAGVGDGGADADSDRCKRLADWLDESNRVLRAHRVRPTFSDILFVRDTLHFGLSANAGKAGFAVSYAFETSNDRRLGRIKAAFAELADKLTAYDGRVYLVKNVYASQATLATMYGENVIAFLKLKRALDPDRLLDNDFLLRTFGDLADDVYAGAYDSAPA